MNYIYKLFFQGLQVMCTRSDGKLPQSEVWLKKIQGGYI